MNSSNGERLGTGIDSFAGDDRGATAIEYGLIAAGIALVIIGVTFTLGTNVQTLFTTVATGITTLLN